MSLTFKEWFRKITAFVASNFLGTVVDTVVLWLCSHFLFKSYVGQYIISPVISFECSVFVNFLNSYYFIWKNRISKRTKGSFFRHFLGYNLSCAGVFIIKMGLLLLIERILGWNVVFCNLLALCFTGLINFSMGEFVIFRKKKQNDASVH